MPIFNGLFGAFLVFFGVMVKLVNAGHILIPFSKKSYSRKELSKLCGNHLIFLGVMQMLAALAGVFYILLNPESEKAVEVLCDLFVIITILLTVVRLSLRIRYVPIEKA